MTQLPSTVVACNTCGKRFLSCSKPPGWMRCSFHRFSTNHPSGAKCCWQSSRKGACNTCGSRSEEHTSELQSRPHLVCRLLLEKKKQNINPKKLNTHKT